MYVNGKKYMLGISAEINLFDNVNMSKDNQINIVVIQLFSGGIMTKQFIGVDFGSKRIGLAIGSDREGIAMPLCAVENKASEEAVIEEIRNIAVEEGVGAFVIGLPLNMDGTEGTQAEKTREFAEKLKEKTGLEIYYIDERLTSFAAEQAVAGVPLTRKRKKSHVNMIAAQVILQTFLEREKGAQEEKQS
jgi:putative Holliday junction resolvase